MHEIVIRLLAVIGICVIGGLVFKFAIELLDILIKEGDQHEMDKST